MALIQKYSEKKPDVVDRMLADFDEFFNTTHRFPTFLDTKLFNGFNNYSSVPKVDVIEHNDKIEINAEIPGLEKTDIQLKVEKGNLIIEGKHGEEKEEKDTKYLYRERKACAFKRAFHLGDNLDGDKIEAEYKNGILNINIPKIEPKKEEAKVISVK